MILSDTHTHTHFSTDSEASSYEMLHKAQAKGLGYLCITDHMDPDFPGDSSLFVFDPKLYFLELSALKKEAAGGPTRLLSGIELGLRPGREDLRTGMKQMLKDFPFDFVIGSTHIVDEMDPYEKIYWEKEEKPLLRYFETVYANTYEHDFFDSLGHLDYVVRYMPSDMFSVRDYQTIDYRDLLEGTLSLIANRGQALEVNSAGLRKGLGFPHPKKELLIRFRELGGELVTLGSDAHTTADVGAEIKESAELLRSCGFRYYTVFENRKPVMLSLE